MLKLITIIGARPQIIKSAALSRVINNKYADKINEVLVHTGQHYDANMSHVFFNELAIPTPNYNLGIGSEPHGKQTALMIQGIEKILLNEKPNAVVVYGDTNSTLAGALAASKLNIPVIHIEAGLRSFTKSMPEEINRVVCDHLSTLLFTPTLSGYRNLLQEGFKVNDTVNCSINNPKFFHCGDVMYDNTSFFTAIAEKNYSKFLSDNDLQKDKFVLATIHRSNNTDDKKRFNIIIEILNTLSIRFNQKIVFPIHPRTAKMMEINLNPELYKAFYSNKLILTIPPVSFLEMLVLEKNSMLVITDSGGVQKEAYFFNKPSIIIRSETEWLEIVENDAARVCDIDEQKISEAFVYFSEKKDLKFPSLFGDGNAAEFICDTIIQQLG